MQVRIRVGLFVGAIALSFAVTSAQAQTQQGDTVPRGGGDPICGCVFDETGAQVCAFDWACAGAVTCDINNPCQAGEVCVTDNCCSAPLDAGSCAPACRLCNCSDGGTASGGDCGVWPLCPPDNCAIPAVSEWGLIVLAMLGLTVGTIIFRRKYRLQSA